MTKNKDAEHLIPTVRWHEKNYLWACHLYYKENGSPASDEEYDASERCLELNRDLWSDYFKSHLPEPDKPLKPQAHAIKLSDAEIANARKWVRWRKFLSDHSK